MNKQSFYTYAFEYLVQMSESPKCLVIKMIDPPAETLRLESKQKLYYRLLTSIKNANMKNKVIGDIQVLGDVLFEFDPNAILEEFGSDHEKLFSEIEKKVPLPNNKTRPNNTRSIWPQFCRAILSSAVFLGQFSNKDEFYKWADVLYDDERSRPALPLILSEEIYGLGYALACDFIKESGYTKFGKPDVHVKDILMGLGFCEKNVRDYWVQKLLIQLAKESDVSTYTFDKVLYLIGSGRFDEDLGLKKVKGQKREFICKALAEKNLWESPQLLIP